MGDCENEVRITGKILTDSEGINPDGDDQAHGNPYGRAGSRVPKTDDGCRRRQLG